jgi:hypothetical protein
MRSTFLGSERLLKSAYGHYSAAGEPPFTSFNYRRQWTIDYIFHSANAWFLDFLCVHLSLPLTGAGQTGSLSWSRSLIWPLSLQNLARLSGRKATLGRMAFQTPNSRPTISRCAPASPCCKPKRDFLRALALPLSCLISEREHRLTWAV